MNCSHNARVAPTGGYPEFVILQRAATRARGHGN
jgi:hypothetical protein